MAERMSMYTLSLDPKADDAYQVAYDKWQLDNPKKPAQGYDIFAQMDDADKAGRRAVRRYVKRMGIVLED